MNSIRIGRRIYTVTSVKLVENNFGQAQRWTDMKGPRGADVTLIETTCDWGTVAKLIHFGRRNPSETIDHSLIERS